MKLQLIAFVRGPEKGYIRENDRCRSHSLSGICSVATEIKRLIRDNNTSGKGRSKSHCIKGNTLWVWMLPTGAATHITTWTQTPVKKTLILFFLWGVRVRQPLPEGGRFHERIWCLLEGNLWVLSASWSSHKAIYGLALISETKFHSYYTLNHFKFIKKYEVTWP
jgi:hypothetical protein